MNIIFLDVDGVLNSLPYCTSFPPYAGMYNEINDYNLQRLSKIYHASKARIVLSSTWRTLDTTDNMYKYLVSELNRYNISISDHTPYIRNERPLEIVSWLDSHKSLGVDNFVSLDDDFSKESYAKYCIEDHLVQTKYFCHELSDGGLQDRHVEQALKILKVEVENNECKL